jgi:hypothetical protein
MQDIEAFQKIIDKQKAELGRIRSVLDSQKSNLARIKADYEKLGIDREKLPPLESLPPEYRERLLAFERDLKALGDMTRSVPVKPGVAKGKMRRNIV